MLEKKERKRILLQLQISAEKEGSISRMPFLLLKKLACPLQCIGGIVLGIFLGVFSTLISFIIFIYFLHLEF
ncbi:MAG: hypothetical protein MRJ65_16885 [Candidatus Brocadiaceae bacterium]|nr:hypothetical protein [Candidatus Brocadiaceae bacterium]